MCAGLEFQVSEHRVGDSIYNLWFRDLLETVTLLIGRVGKHLEIPQVLPEGADISEMWHARAYQRELRNFIAVGGNLEEDVLVPLMLYSGASHACKFWHCGIIEKYLLVCHLSSAVRFIDLTKRVPNLFLPL